MSIDFTGVLPFVLTHYGFLVFLALVSYGIGRRLTGSIAYSSLAEEFSISCSLGLGVIAYLVLLLGLLKILYIWPAIIILAICLFWGLSPIMEFCHTSPRQFVSKFRAMGRVRQAGTLTVCIVAAAASIPLFLLPLYPPTQFDATMYHLAVAKRFVLDHGVIPTPNLRVVVFPQMIQMFFTLMLLLCDDVAGQLSQFLMMAVVAVALYAWGRQLLSSRTGFWSAALFLANPVVLWSGSVAYIDMGLTLFVTMALYTFWKWLFDRENHWLVLSGIFCGFAVSTKYTGIFFLGLLGLITLSVALKTKKYRVPLTFVTIVLAVAAPWYVRNIYYTTNPVFPFFPGVFNSSWKSDYLEAQLGELFSTHGIGHNAKSFILLPWYITFHQDLFLADPGIAHLYFFLLPLILIAAAKDRRTAIVFGFSMAFVFFWFFTAQVLRYLEPILPTTSLASAAALDYLIMWIRPVRKWAFAGWLTAFVFVLFVYGGWAYARDRVQQEGLIPVTQQERNNYLSQRLPTFEAYKFLNYFNGRDYTVYALDDESMAYFADGRFMGDWFGPARFSRITSKITDARALYTELINMGVDYFLVSNRRGRANLPEDNFFRQKFKTVYVRPNVTIFGLVDPSLPASSTRQLLQNPDLESLEDQAPLGWNSFGKPEVDTSGKQSFRGLVAVYCKGTTNVFNQKVPVEKGKFYFLSFHARTSANKENLRLQVNWANAKGELVWVTIDVAEAGPTWSRYSMTVQAPDNASNAIVYASPHERSSVWFDTFSFTQIESR